MEKPRIMNQVLFSEYRNNRWKYKSQAILILTSLLVLIILLLVRRNQSLILEKQYMYLEIDSLKGINQNLEKKINYLNLQFEFQKKN